MSDITLHTGCQGDRFGVNLDWHDHNNIRHNDKLEIKIRDRDKPRTLIILLNDVTIAEVVSNL